MSGARPKRSESRLNGISRNESVSVPADTARLAMVGEMPKAVVNCGRIGCVP